MTKVIITSLIMLLIHVSLHVQLYMVVVIFMYMQITLHVHPHIMYYVGDGVGRAILGGGALFGVGSLCFYGLGLSGETGAIDRAGYAVE